MVILPKYIIVFFGLFLFTVSQTIDFKEIINKDGKQVKQIMINNDNMLIFIDKQSFILNKDQSTSDYPSLSPFAINNNQVQSSTLIKPSNGNLIIACGSKHLTMIQQNGQNLIEYSSTIAVFSKPTLCSIVEVNQNVFLLAYRSDTNNEYVLELINLDGTDISKPIFANKQNNKITDLATNTYNMIICERFNIDEMCYFCIYLKSEQSKIHWITYNAKLEFMKNNELNVNSLRNYRLFQAANNKILLFLIYKYNLDGRIITASLDISYVPDIGKVINILQKPDNFDFKTVSLAKISDNLFISLLNSARYVFIQKMDNNLGLVGKLIENELIKKWDNKQLIGNSIGAYDDRAFIFIITDSLQKNWSLYIVLEKPTCDNKSFNTKTLDKTIITISNQGKFKIIGKSLANPSDINLVPVLNTLNSFEVTFIKQGTYIYHYIYIDEYNDLSSQCEITLKVIDFYCKNEYTYDSVQNKYECLECIDGIYKRIINSDNTIDCVPECLSDTYFYKQNDKEYCLPDKQCNDKYPYHWNGTKQCVDSCDDGHIDKNEKPEECYIPSCPDNKYIMNNKYCVDKCENDALYHIIDSKHCIDKCTTEYPYNNLKDLYECTIDCGNIYVNQFKNCIPKCDLYVLSNLAINKCIENCPYHYFQNISNEILIKNCTIGDNEEYCLNNYSNLNSQTNECVTHCRDQPYCENHCPPCPTNPMKYLRQSTCECYTKDELHNIINNEIKNLTIPPTVINIENSTYEIFYGKNITENRNKTASIISVEEINKIKYHCNIPIDHDIIIFKNDTYFEGKLVHQSKYQFYYLQDGKLIDLSKCGDGHIEINFPITNTSNIDYLQMKNLSDLGIDPFDALDPFFNDPCYLFDTFNGTDIPRKNRFESYLKDNGSLCPDGFEFQGIDFTTNTSKCSFATKPIKVESSFDDFKNGILNALIDGNWDVVLCYNLAFNRKILIKNIGFWVYLLAMIISIGISIWFCKVNMNPFRVFLNKMIPLSPPLKGSQKQKSKIELQSQSESISVSAFRNNNLQPSQRQMINNMEQVENNVVIKSKIDNQLQSGNNSPVIEHSRIPARSIVPNTTSIIKKEYSYEEYDAMSFPDLYSFDFRNIMQHYWDILKAIHPIIYTFCTKSNHALKTIKIQLFIIGITIDFAFSAFFYSDYYISNNYTGNSSFFSDLPVSMYTFLVSTVFNIGFGYLTEAGNDITKIIKEISIQNRNDMMIKFLACYKKKMIAFFIIIFTLLIGFWYYATCFCAVYQNSQIDWLTSGLTSMAISQAFPFVFALISASVIQLSLVYNSLRIYKLFCMIRFLLG